MPHNSAGRIYTHLHECAESRAPRGRAGVQASIQHPGAAWMTDELQTFADAVDRFAQRECVPHLEAWRTRHEIPRDLWLKAGDAGLLLASTSPEYGGGGGSFAHEAI